VDVRLGDGSDTKVVLFGDGDIDVCITARIDDQRIARLLAPDQVRRVCQTFIIDLAEKHTDSVEKLRLSGRLPSGHSEEG
jgi:hypothetical protein